MSYSQRISQNEQAMVDVLNSSDIPLNLSEIVEAIHSENADILKGKTPERSLYSIIYRREMKRKEFGCPPLFLTTKRGGTQYYSLNREAK